MNSFTQSFNLDFGQLDFEHPHFGPCDISSSGTAFVTSWEEPESGWDMEVTGIEFNTLSIRPKLNNDDETELDVVDNSTEELLRQLIIEHLSEDQNFSALCKP